LRDAAGYKTESPAPTKVTDKDVKILALAIDATKKETGLLIEAQGPADGPDAESRDNDEKIMKHGRATRLKHSLATAQPCLRSFGTVCKIFTDKNVFQ
jgi:hypothetical protein